MYNEGLVTLVDGMNNQAPVFGFAVGNLIGLHEVDMQSVELTLVPHLPLSWRGRLQGDYAQ